MKSTGVIRRIDDLGRIVIPKEIRRSLRIREGENLEIYTDKNLIILEKYSLLDKIQEYANNLAEAIYSIAKHNVIITDNDTIIACSGPLKERYISKKISEDLSNRIRRRENINEKYKKELKISDDLNIECTYALSTVISNGDAAGLVLIFSENNIINESDLEISQVASKFLSKALEE